MSIKPSLGRQRGVSMIELIIFIVIISAVLAGMLSMMASMSSKTVDPILRKQALLRAESLLEEVGVAHFTYCHPEDASAESALSSAGCASMPERFGPQLTTDARPFANINDYASAPGAEAPFNAADPSGNIVTDATGATMLPAGYRTMVSITPVSGFGPAGLQIADVTSPATTADTDVLLITVTVAYPGGAVRLDRYRTRYAPNARP